MPLKIQTQAHNQIQKHSHVQHLRYITTCPLKRSTNSRFQPGLKSTKRTLLARWAPKWWWLDYHIIWALEFPSQAQRPSPYSTSRPGIWGRWAQILNSWEKSGHHCWQHNLLAQSTSYQLHNVWHVPRSRFTQSMQNSQLYGPWLWIWGESGPSPLLVWKNHRNLPCKCHIFRASVMLIEPTGNGIPVGVLAQMRP